MDELLVIQLILWSPSILFGGLFAFSAWREPRQFRNAIFFLLFALWTALMLLMRYGQEWMIVPLLFFVVLFPLVAAAALVANAVVVVRRNGMSAASLLPAALAALLIGLYIALPLSAVLAAPAWVLWLMGLFVLEGMWFSFTLVALLLYSWLYRLLPRRRSYDYIVVHGAGLVGTSPSPLLAGRLDRALDLWEHQGRTGVFVVSGGQGADEEVSEACAMHCYLVAHGVPEDQIVDEDRSTTTMENLRFSKELMDARSGPGRYRAAVVSSDYHVFRCAEYAHKLGMRADGVGSHTRGWYWPAAFIREFVSVTRAHLWPYVVIAAVWALPLVGTALIWLIRVVIGMLR